MTYLKAIATKSTAALLAIGILLTATPAMAWDYSSPQPMLIETIEVWPTGNFVVSVASDKYLCGSGSTHRTFGTFQIGIHGMSAETVRAMLSTVTAAKLAGRQVAFFASTIDGVCQVGSVRVH